VHEKTIKAKKTFPGMKNTDELFKLALVTTMATLGKTELHVTFHTIPLVLFSPLIFFFS